jgi:hypothetical protein
MISGRLNNLFRSGSSGLAGRLIVIFTDELLGHGDILLATDENGRSLMNLVGFQIENPLAACSIK